MASKLGLSMNKAVAVVEHLKLRDDTDCYKEIRIGKSIFKRYPPRAIEKMQTCLKKTSSDEIWEVRKRSA